MTTSDGTGASAWAIPVKEGQAKTLMDRVLADAASSGSEVLVLDGDLVFGADHMRSALMHATKAMDEGRNASDSLAMETLLYASGERQLSSAIKKMSVGPRTSVVVVAVVAGTFSPGHGWTELPAMDQGPDTERLARFGITEKEMATVARDRSTELVLERVAAVDVIKR